MLSTHFRLLPRLRISGAISLLPLYDLTGTALPFYVRAPNITWFPGSIPSRGKDVSVLRRPIIQTPRSLFWVQCGGGG
jgi:hypothetical protein